MSLASRLNVTCTEANACGHSPIELGKAKVETANSVVETPSTVPEVPSY